MSYDIYIGNADLDYDADPDYPRVVVGVEPEVHPDAPEFPGDKMTGKGNSRHPGYSNWTDFTRQTGLYDLFFSHETGLMRQHPGAQVLLPAQVQAVELERKAWEDSHPDSKPGWCMCEKCNNFHREKDKEHRELDGTLARLLWLEWWMKWALDNCDMPTIHNH